MVSAVGQDHAHARDGVSRQAALLAEVQEALLHTGHERLGNVRAGRDVLRRWHFFVVIIVSEVISKPPQSFQVGHLYISACYTLVGFYLPLGQTAKHGLLEINPQILIYELEISKSTRPKCPEKALRLVKST